MSPRRFPLPPLLCCVLLSMGCGVETYQSRVVGNANPFFAYHDELNANLAPRWSKGEVSLRLPLGMKELPAPKKDDKAARDRRIPDRLAIERLTGMLGGFQGEAEAESPGGKTTATQFYAMILSNRVLLSSRDRKVNPADFERALINRLSEGLGNFSPAPKRRLVVGTQDFAAAVDYDVTVFDVADAAPPMRYEVYFHYQGPLQVAVVFGYPRDLGGRDVISRQIDLSLQTLQITAGGTSSTTAPGASGNRPAF